MNESLTVDKEVLTVIYQSLLERDPDPAGIANWCHGATVDEVLRSVKQSDEYREKIRARAEMASFGDANDQAMVRDAAAVIQHSRGMANVFNSGAAFSPVQVFNTLPWGAIRPIGDQAHTFRVLGPYASLLSKECARRFRHIKVIVGMPSGGGAPVQDAIILTDPMYLAALAAYWPTMIVNTRHRIVTPSLVDLGGVHTLTMLHSESIRRILHDHSFIEVASMFRRRGDVEVLLETTQLTHAAGAYRRVQHSVLRSVERPQVWWLAANRVPVEDR